MAIGSVQLAQVSTPGLQPSFSGKKVGDVSVKEYPDHFEKRTVVEATTGKKWGVGIASGVLSGLGQFINGDVGKGFAFLAGGIATCVGLFMSKSKVGGIGCLLANAGVGIWSIIDAVKNAKSTVVTIEDKK